MGCIHMSMEGYHPNTGHSLKAVQHVDCKEAGRDWKLPKNGC